MKLIIDIDKELANKEHWYTDKEIWTVIKAAQNGTPILDNDCDNCEKAWTDKCERAECYDNNYKHWTPYQKGGKE